MYKLYWAANTAAFAPQAVLEEADLPYERVEVDMAAEETRQADYLAMNPAGYVPTLVTPQGQVVFESAAVVLFLCDHHDLFHLIPEPHDPQKGLFYRSLFYMTNTVQEAYKTYYYAERYGGPQVNTDLIQAQAMANLWERWSLVEDQLAANGPYLLGEGYSACDIYLLMLAHWFPSLDDLLRRFPAMARCVALTSERPAIRRTLAAHGLV